MSFSFTCLGGVSEIGMNCYVYETDTSAIIVDCGVKFADEYISSVDFIIPDFSYLHLIKDKLKAVIFTHAHEDHIGAVSFLLAEFDIPIVADHYTMAMIDHKLSENKISTEKIYLNALKPLEIADFIINALPVSHSIMSTKVLHISLKDGFSLMHISDYKIDFAPYKSSGFILKPFLDIASKGLDCLMADSTNALSPGFTKSEKSIKNNLSEIISLSSGRVFFTTFSSNTERIGMIFEIAKKYNKKIVLEGSSLIKNISIARKHSFITLYDDLIISRKKMNEYDDDKIIIIASGSQGEQSSVISKISQNNYGLIDIRPTDTFIFSSRIIPGNERKIIKILNNISQFGATLIQDLDHNIHSSGHANIEDIKFLIKLLHPNYLIPIHGENIHINNHKYIATSNNLLDNDSILLSGIGKKINFQDGIYIDTSEVTASRRYVDNFSSEILSSDDILDRLRLSDNGAITIILIVDISNGSLAKEPIITTVGFNIDDREKKNLSSYIIAKVDNEIFERMVLSSWQEFIFGIVKKYFKKLYNRRPLISIYVGE